MNLVSNSLSAFSLFFVILIDFDSKSFSRQCLKTFGVTLTPPTLKFTAHDVDKFSQLFIRRRILNLFVLCTIQMLNTKINAIIASFLQERLHIENFIMEINKSGSAWRLEREGNFIFTAFAYLLTFEWQNI